MAGPDTVLAEMVLRLDQLSQQLTSKDTELSHARARCVLLDKELARSKAETASARDELQREALKNSLLSQRLTSQQEETQSLVAQLHNTQAAASSRDRTLSSVQNELSQVQQLLTERTKELREKVVYYDSLIEAKEASIGSLQQLLAAQQKAAKEQQYVWEDELRTLKETLLVAQAGAAVQQQREQLRDVVSDVRASVDQQVPTLRSRVLELEQENQELNKRCRHLESHLREREKLLVKADKRYQELNRRASAMGLAQPSQAIATGRQAAEQAWGAGLAAVPELQSQLLLLQDAFQEEQRKHERLGARLAAKTQEATTAAQELQAIQLQLAQVQQQLDKTMTESDKKLSLLGAELDEMRTRHATTTATVQAAHESAMAEEREQAARLRQDLEAQVQQLTAALGSRSLGEQAASSLLQSRAETLQQEVADKSSTLTQLQHSLYLIRAHWGGLKRHVLALQEELKGAQAVKRLLAAAADPAVGVELDVEDTLQGADAAAQSKCLMKDWDPTHKASFDSAVEESISAACGILEHAVTVWQGLVHQARHTAQSMATATAASAVPSASQSTVVVHPLLQAAQVELQQARAQASASDRAASVARMSAMDAEERLVAAQNEALALRREVTAKQDALQEAQQAASLSQKELQQLRLALQGSKGELERLVASRDSELAAAKRTIEDLNTTVGVMHVRLEHMQKNWAQVDELKARLASIMAAALVPCLVPGSVGASTTNTSSSGPPQLKSDVTGLLDTILQGGGKQTSSKAKDVDAIIAAGDGSSAGVQKRLDKAVESLLAQVQAALAGCAVLETRHWEMERGLDCVAGVRAHLTSLGTELAAGRTSNALVLVKELTALMDSPTQASRDPGPSPVSKVHGDLQAARAAATDVVSGLKTSDALLRAVMNAMPAWMQLARAEANANFRTELSHAKAVVGHRMVSWSTQSSSAAALLAETRGLASQYVRTVESTVDNLRQQVEGLREAGALAADSPALQHLQQLDTSRQVFAAQLQQALEAAAATHVTLDTSTPEAKAAADSPHGPQPTGDPAVTSTAHASATVVPLAHASVAAAAPAPRTEVRKVVTLVLDPPAASVAPGVPASAVQRSPGPSVQHADRLLEPVGHLQDALSSIRGELSSLQAERASLTSDRARLLHHLDCVRQRCQQLAHTLGSVLPLPADLVQGLQDGVLGSMQLPSGAQGGGVGGITGEEEELVAEKLLRTALSIMEELVLSFLAQLQQSSATHSSVQLQEQVVQPLQARCQDLEAQLAQSQQSMAELERQVCELLTDADTRLEEVREASQEAAQAALATALGTLRHEIRSIEAQLKSLREQSTAAVNKAAEDWAEVAATAASSASRAVAALSSTASALQAQLAQEQKAHEETRTEASASLQTASRKHEANAAELTRTKSQLLVSQQQLGFMEAEQAGLERETADLRRSLLKSEASRRLGITLSEDEGQQGDEDAADQDEA